MAVSSASCWGSVFVFDDYIFRAGVGPVEAGTILIVDPDTMLALPIAL